MAEDQTNQGFRQRQRMIMAVIIVIAMGIGYLVYSEQLRKLQPPPPAPVQDIVSLSRIDDLAPEDAWVELAEGRVLNLEDNVAQVLENNEQLLQQNQALQQAQKDFLDQTQQALDIQRSLLEEAIEQRLSQIENQRSNIEGEEQIQVGQLVRFSLDPLPRAQDQDLVEAQREEEDRLRREQAIRQKRYLPAGSYAPAVITAGAAATISATGSGAARPVVMRITGKAQSAASKNGSLYEVDIRGCTITGEANGDLSSERVYIRLLVMTCRFGQQITETQVRGFVAGSGQTGVRGPVIRREGDLIAKSFAAGFVSGFGEVLSDAVTAQVEADINSGNTNNNSPDSRLSDSELTSLSARGGVGTGLGSAGERLADYFISRAEQYQPVVSLRGGTVVDVIFIDGVELKAEGLFKDAQPELLQQINSGSGFPRASSVFEKQPGG